MTCKELVCAIENPLDDISIMDDLIDIYLERPDHIYSGLVKNDFYQNQKKKTCVYGEKLRDDFYLAIFRDWKEAIQHISRKGLLSKEENRKARILSFYLNGCNPTNYDEIMEVLNGENATIEIREALTDFRWDLLGSFSSWKHIDSRYIYGRTHKRNEISHRLYINCDSYLSHFIGLEFIKKCKERRLKFYFKFDGRAERDDTMVFYSDTKNLCSYIEILEEIKDEFGLEDSLYNPPMLTGKIHGWIGYGSEPNIVGNRYSFNSLRELHLTKCIHKEVGSWVRNHLGITLNLNGRRMSNQSYIEQVLLNCVEESARNSIYYSFCEDELQSVEFRRAVLTGIRNHFSEILDIFEGFKDQFDDQSDDVSLNSVVIPFHDKKIYLSIYHVREAFCKQIELLRGNDPQFRERLRKRIIMTSPSFGISANYAVDMNSIPLFRKQIQSEEKESIQSSTHKSRVKRREWIPMTDEEIRQARIQLGYEKKD